MEAYDYRAVVLDKAVDEINEMYREGLIEDLEDKDYYDLRDFLVEELESSEAVTGSTIGSYTLNRWEAEENLCHNWDLVGELIDEGFIDLESIKDSEPESLDVAIRVYLVSQVIDDAILLSKLPEENKKRR